MVDMRLICAAGREMKAAEGRPTFCEQKVAKKLFYAGLWALSPITPIAQIRNKFLRRFFQKAAAFF
jgi:hypothetical protein